VVIARSLAGMEADVRPLSLAAASPSSAIRPMPFSANALRAPQSGKRWRRLPEHPHAGTVERVRAATASADALVAVGSGTINDLCKYASARDGKSYVVFGTAPSMNGYTSLNAAITVRGHKKSLPAQAPAGAFLDLSILAAAPVRMIRSGLGDSLCRATAQADWLLSHLLFELPYRTMPFVLLAEDEPSCSCHGGAGERRLHAMEKLVRTLLLSASHRDLRYSSPASQGEH
jgi:glycerol-1-phosphate dehydrogenase [NAD(P)+]